MDWPRHPGEDVTAFAEALAVLHDAAAGSASWPDALRAIAAVLEADRALLLAAAPCAGATPIDAAHALDAPADRACARQRIADALGAGTASPAEPGTHAFAGNALVLRVDATPPGASAFPPAYLYLAREPGHACQANPAQRVRGLLPHLRRALARYWQGEIARLTAAQPVDFLEWIGTGTLLLDAGGRIVRANARARALIERYPLLTAPANAGAEHRRTLAQAVRRALAGETATLRFSAQEHAEWLILRLLPLRAAHPFTPDARVIVHLLDPAETIERGIAAMAQHYRLSPAERRVLALLADDRPARAIAEQLAISIATVRTHLRNLFIKTGTASQRELLRLLTLHAASPTQA